MSAAALKERLRADLKSAMQAKASNDVSLLRSLIAALDNAEAVPVADLEERLRNREAVGEVARRELDAGAVAEVLDAERQSRLQAAQDYEGAGLPEDAARLRAEAEVIARYRT